MKDYIKLTKTTYSEQIIEQIKELVETGILKPSDKLPPPKGLAQMLGISMIPLKEALKTLQFMNVIEVTTDGFIIKGMGKAKLLELLEKAANSHDSLNDLKEARMALELKAIELACIRRNEEDLERINLAMISMKEEIELNKGTGIIGSLEFHNAIIEACGNQIIFALTTYINEQLVEGRKESLKIPGRYKVALEEHEQIYKAIKEQNIDKAIKCLKSHLETSY